MSAQDVVDAFPCPLCRANRAVIDRLIVQVLELRLQVADGPRARVNELEEQCRVLNARLAAKNRSGRIT